MSDRQLCRSVGAFQYGVDVPWCTKPKDHEGDHSTWSLGDFLEVTWGDKHSVKPEPS